MKKNLAIIMAAALSLSLLSGCGSSSTETTAAATTAATEAATEAETEKEEETTAAETTEAAAEETTEAAAAGSEELEGGDGSLDRVLAAGKIVMATSPDFAPWEFQDTSSGQTEYVGSDIELAKYIAEQLGVELEIRPMEFSAILQAINSETVDMGISGFAYTEERAEAMNLSTHYNASNVTGQGILVMKDQTSTYNTAEAFAGKKVAAQNASLQAQLVSSELPEDVEMQLVTNVTEGVLMLTTGRVDALAVSEDNGLSLAAKYPEVAMADFMFDYSNDGNVVGIKKGNNDLTNAINKIIDQVNEEGLYEQWKADAIELAESLNIEVH